MKLIQDLSDAEMVEVLEAAIECLEAHWTDFVCVALAKAMFDLHRPEAGRAETWADDVDDYAHPLLRKHGFRVDGGWREYEGDGDYRAERVAFLSALADGFREQTKEE